MYSDPLVDSKGSELNAITMPKLQYEEEYADILHNL